MEILIIGQVNDGSDIWWPWI